MDCKSKTKTKLGSTTDTKSILIVGEAQLIVNKCMQVRHYVGWHARPNRKYVSKHMIMYIYGDSRASE